MSVVDPARNDITYKLAYYGPGLSGRRREGLVDNLQANGRSLATIPVVYQYNKRDLPDLLSVEQMDRDLNPEGAPRFVSVARRGEGVLEALQECTRRMVARST